MASSGSTGTLSGVCGATAATPGVITGRIAYSMELLGRPFTEGPWSLAGTF